MVMYYVISQDGQKFGPADVPTLNQWITEGRLAPDTLLQDASTGAQVLARGIPALKFGFNPPIAPPTSNPYDMPSPVQAPAYPRYQQPWHQPQGVSSGQLVGAWICTALAPIFIFICYIGLGMSIFGIVTGSTLYKQNSTAAGLAMIIINSLWLAIYLALRIALLSGWDPFR